MSIPGPTRRYLADDSLAPLWTAVRRRLERNGLRVEGSVGVELTVAAADRLSGLLGRRIEPGRRRVSLSDLDAVLRGSAAQSSLATVVAALTGPLRDLRSERTAVDAEWADVWADLDRSLREAKLLDATWVGPWTSWLRGGVCRRAGAVASRAALPPVVAVLAQLTGVDAPDTPQPLGALAARVTGDAHGLDADTLTATLVLRGLTMARNEPPAVSAAERRRVWADAGVATDQVSGTVLTWGLRPAGDDAWARMMRERAELGLVTHLTALELHGRPLKLDGPVHATENPQVLQAAAKSGVPGAVVCFAGQPSLAGSLLLERLGPTVRYHGDFDWPGIAIAARIFAGGAAPWRFGARDYLEALDRTEVALLLTGPAQPTPWDTELGPVMFRRSLAVHEEAVIDVLLSDLG